MRGLALVALAALLLVAVGCGGGSDNKSSSNAGSGEVAAKSGKQGGSITVLSSSDVDYLDPGHTYYTIGYGVAYPTQRPLYSFKPGSNDPVPDLADGPPQISSDNKTITVKLRTGVKFSPPVNRAVTSKDVKYAFERAFTANVANEYTTYFTDIVGAPSKPGSFKTISGITTPDDQTLVIKLAKPAGVGVAAALVMPITAPVPEEYAKKYDAKNPSTYNTHVIATGPYMVKNDATGKLTGYKPGTSIQLVRNKNWDKSTDFKPAYLDSILIRTNATNASVSARQTLTGSKLMTNENPPAAELKLAVQKYKGQWVQLPGGGFRYFPLNTTIKPFDNINVRKAIIASFDRDAVRLARGGKFVGDIPTHFIPPGIPGFEEAGGAAGPGVDFLKNPKGDMAVAAKYMKAGGFPSGKYTGGKTFQLVASNSGPGKAQSEVAQAQFLKLGFKVKLLQVPQDSVYTDYCQVPKKKLFSCGGAGWFKDFNDPQSMLEPTFKGSAININGGNNNLAQLKDPKIDAAMNQAATLRGTDRAKAWADIDKMIVEDAPAVPFLWDKTTVLESKDVQGAGNAYYDSWDLAFTSLK
jgi:peptide/nickel transport system substrate-binding protein